MSPSKVKGYIAAVLLVFTSFVAAHAQWQRLNLPSSAKVNSLAISDSIIFAGTDGDGIFVSTDNGENWVSMNNGLQSGIIHTILINGAAIFAGTETGVSVSTNNGLTWVATDSGLPGEGVWSLAARNLAPMDSTIFAGTWSGVYKSTNNGENWEATGLINTTMPVHSLIVRNDELFAATLGGGVFHSQFDGFSWDDISIKYSEMWSGAEFLEPVYSLARIDTNIIASVESGYFYYYAAHVDTPFAPIGAPKRNEPILCFASYDARLFAGNSIGDIFYSGFNGLSWTLASFPLTGHPIYSLALNNLYYFAGTESGVWRLSNPETGIHAHEDTPTGFALYQNYPNPFNPTTMINYQLAALSDVTLKVYDMIGREVATLVNEKQDAGTHFVKFDGTNLPSGTYFCRLHCGSYNATRKLLLLK
jgi:ligand-binding sensor domain-containing protein